MHITPLQWRDNERLWCMYTDFLSKMQGYIRQLVVSSNWRRRRKICVSYLFSFIYVDIARGWFSSHDLVAQFRFIFSFVASLFTRVGEV